MPSKAIQTLGGYTFEKEVEEVFVGTFQGLELDPDWTYVDKEGHTCTQDSVEWFVDSVEYCPQCEEDHEEGHWVCPLCLEKVERGQRPEQSYVPGMIHYWINGESVDEDTFKRKLREACDESS